MQQELKDEICFNYNRLHFFPHGIVFCVSEANMCSQIKSVSAVVKSSCKSRYLTDMENMLSDIKYTDLEIHCKDGKVQKCHKILLAARSPVFKTMLESDFKEGNTGIIKLEYMELEYVKVNKALLLNI